MNPSTGRTGRTIWVAIRAMAVFTLLLGVVYTFAITGAGQLLFPSQSNGSMLSNTSGERVGSALIGQSFSDTSGEPLPQYFQPRPSAAGDGYDGGASSGSNLGPENDALIESISERKAQLARFNGVSEAEVPADAVTASSSGLDPHISPEYAAIQVNRVAKARGLSVETVRALLEQHVRGPILGYLGESTVNVLELNLALDSGEGRA